MPGSRRAWDAETLAGMGGQSCTRIRSGDSSAREVPKATGRWARLCGPLRVSHSGSLCLRVSGVCFVGGPRCPSACRAASSTFLISCLPSGPPCISCHGAICSSHTDTRPGFLLPGWNGVKPAKLCSGPGHLWYVPHHSVTQSVPQ